MKEVSELKAMLGQFFIWNKTRLDCFAQMLLTLFVVHTVNLSELAVAMGSWVGIGSRYKRLQRFFSQLCLDYNDIARLIFNLRYSGKKIYLTIDRTNWFLGKAKLLAIGFCWAHKVGEWRAEIKAIRWSKHHNSIRPQNSYLRYGLDCVREIIINPFKKIADFRRVLALFEPEPVAQREIS